MLIKSYLILGACLVQFSATAQVQCRQAWPTLGNRGSSNGLWPGGLLSFFCTGLTLSKPLVKPTKVPLPFKVEGIRVSVGVDDSGAGGLPAPILEVADLGAFQQVTVQVPWEYQRYTLSSTGITSEAPQGVMLMTRDGTIAQWLAATSVYPISPLFEDQNGYALAQHSTDLAWVTPANPAHPGEVIILHAANLGMVVNPPPTGYPTPPYLSTIFSDQGSVAGPIRLDTTHSSVEFGLVDLNINDAVPGPQVLSITLEPGTVSRYLAVIKLPDPGVLPSGSKIGIFAAWSFCPLGPVTIFCRQGRRLVTNPSPSKLAIAVP